MTNRVRDILTGAEPISLGKHHRNVLDPLLARWYSDDSWKETLADGFRELLLDPDPKLRSAAVIFFASYTADPGDLAIQALRDHLPLYDGVEPEWRPGTDLRALLASTVARQIGTDRDALELTRREALRPGHGQAVIALLLPADPLWVRDHAVELVDASPGLLIPLLFHLQIRPVDLQPLLERLSGHIAPEVLVDAVEREAPAVLPWLRERLGLPSGDLPSADPIHPQTLARVITESEGPLVVTADFGLDQTVELMSELEASLGQPVRPTFLAGLRDSPLSPSRIRELGALAGAEGTLWLLGSEGAAPDVLLAAGTAISEHKLTAVVQQHPDSRGLLSRARYHLDENAPPTSPVDEHRRLIGMLLDHDASEVFEKLEQLLDMAPGVGEALLLEMASRRMDLRGAIALLRDRVERDTLKAWIQTAVPDELERLVYLAMI